MADRESQPAPGSAEPDPPSDIGLGSTIGLIVTELARLIAQHWALARAEMAASGAALGRTGIFALGGVVTAFLGLAMVLSGAALALALVVPQWLAFLIVGAAVLLLAGGLGLLARAQSRRCAAMPHRAIASLQKNLAELGDQLP